MWPARFAMVIALAALALPGVLAADAPLNDRAGVLSAAERTRIGESLQTMRRTGRARVEVLIVDSTGGVEIGAYARGVLESWPVGAEGADRAAILVVAVADRAYSVQVGRELSATLTPSFCAMLGHMYLEPRFSKQEFAAGIEESLARIAALLDVSAASMPAARDADDAALHTIASPAPRPAPGARTFAIVAGSIGAVVVVVILLRRVLLPPERQIARRRGPSPDPRSDSAYAADALLWTTMGAEPQTGADGASSPADAHHSADPAGGYSGGWSDAGADAGGCDAGGGGGDGGSGGGD